MHLLILGGNSDIGFAIAERFAREKTVKITLASRNMEMLKEKVDSLRDRFGIEAAATPFDATAFDSHASFYESLESKPDVVILAFGYLPDRKDDFLSHVEISKTINTNYLGAVSIGNIIARDFKQRNSGMLVGISSIAGERGRAKNDVYGSSKAGFTAYLSGLRQKLSGTEVDVMTVKPGFIKTKMTVDNKIPAGIPVPAVEKVADNIVKAIIHKKDRIYGTWYWAVMGYVLKIIPEFIFKKLSV